MDARLVVVIVQCLGAEASANPFESHIKEKYSKGIL